MMDKYLECIKNWAKGMRSVCAVLLLDSSEDMDLVIVSSEKDSLTKDTTWLDQFGPVSSFVADGEDGMNSLRVSYDDGQKMHISSVEPKWMSIPLQDGAKAILSKGFSTLYIDFNYLELLHQIKLALAL